MPPILSTRHCSTCLCAHIRKTIRLAPIHSLTTFIVSTMIGLRFLAIDHTSFSYTPYKLLASFKNILDTHHFFHCFYYVLHHTPFVGLQELARAPEVSFKLSFCALIFQITH